MQFLPLRAQLIDYTTTTRAAKYLEVMVNCKLTWRDQLFQTADKAAKGVQSLSWLMANVGGPRSSRRRFLMTFAYHTVSEPTVLLVIAVKL
ncbi:hypothetical protein J6590_058863 [Homalodisca vitripennis]|nr:hypothetical protein J6590_058863 [Homalodisca vitripennis]